MANNLMNDLFDLEVGTDREDYPRNLYSPHPVLSGVDHPQGPRGVRARRQRLCLAIMIVLTVARGWPIVAFALGGFLLSAAYTAPPLRLKKHGLGEPTVLVVWGPLMVGGTYYAATGHDPGRGRARVAAVRAAVHDRADGQAHRQDPVGRARRDAHAAGDPGRGARPGASRRRMFVGFYVVDRRARDRAGAAGCLAAWSCSSLPVLRAHVEGVLASRSPRSRRCRTRCGRCGSRRCRSS